MKAQKKSVIIDYYNYPASFAELRKWVSSFGDDLNKHFNIDESNLYVLTLEGTSYKVTKDDIIIRGIKGEYYPCKKDIFNETYDLIEEKPYTT